MKGMAALSANRRVDSWTVMPGLVSLQTLAMHIMHFLGNEYQDTTLFEICVHISVSQWYDR